MAETRTRGIVLFGGLAWFTTGPLFARRHLNCRTQGSRSGRGEGPPGPPPHDGGDSSRPSRPSSCEDPSAGRLHQHHEVIQPEFGTRSTRRSGSPVPPGYAGEFGFQPHLISCPSWSPPIPPSSRPEGQVLRSSRKSGGAAGLLHDLGVDSLRITSSCFLANKTSARCLPRHEPIGLRSRGMRQEWPVNRRVARGNWGTYPPSSGVQPF